MTKQRKDGGCELNCVDCPLSSSNNGTGISCSHFETGYPEEAIAIMQKWSDEHPQKTYLSELLEHFPNVPLTTTEIPEDICPFHLGFMSKDDCRNDRNCIKCWNQPIKNNEEGEEND
jgi:hypothetical protein